MDLEEKYQDLRGEGLQIATLKLLKCPLCKRVRLTFRMQDNNSVAFFSYLDREKKAPIDRRKT